MIGAPRPRAASATRPAPSPLMRVASSSSASALSTAVKAAALTMTSATAASKASRIEPASARSSSGRPSATTSTPSGARSRRAVATWPCFPVTRMRIVSPELASLELRPEIAEARMPAVLVRQHRFGEIDAPGDAERGIVEGQAPVVRRRIDVGDLVEHFAIRLQGAEAMREADRDQQLPPIGCRKLDRGMASEGRRAAAQIDGDIEHPAARHPHQLVLPERL